NRNTRAGKDVMEIVKEKALPSPLELALRILAPIEHCQRRNLFGVQQPLFCEADSLLRICLRGEDAAMVLEVEFVVPHRDVHTRKFLVQIIEESRSSAELQSREDDIGRHQTHSIVEHRARGTTTVVAHTIKVHHLR